MHGISVVQDNVLLKVIKIEKSQRAKDIVWITLRFYLFCFRKVLDYYNLGLICFSFISIGYDRYFLSTATVG